MPPRAMAYGIRAAVKMMPLFAPSVEIRMATTTSAAPAEPIVTLAASEATSDDLAATVFTSLGIRLDQEMRDPLGRPLPLCTGKPILGLF